MTDLYKKYCECGYRVTTDSRTIEGGEIFFALKGENFDGNAYAGAALDKGARWAVVNASAGLPDDERFIKVEDSFKTLQELAIWHRNHVKSPGHLPVVGLTGTNGKTTTKELIAAVLTRKFKVLATQGNFNNDIGVPLTLLKITPETQIAVVEMGANHPDDIAKLVKVSQPDYGLITNVGTAHLLGFGSFDGVKRAKGELYKWLASREGSVVFLNNDDENLRAMARDWASCHIWPYGIDYQGVELLPVTAEHPFLRLRLRSGRTVETHLVGTYNAANALAALAVGEYFGVSEDDAAEAVSGYLPSNNRSQLRKTGRNTVIVDAYNANPSSMSAALDNFAVMASERKLALLGDMRELGEESVSEHERIVSKLCALGIDAMLVGEEFGKALDKLGKSRDRWFATSADLCSYLKENEVSSTMLLVKGSHSIQMETTLEFL